MVFSSIFLLTNEIATMSKIDLGFVGAGGHPVRWVVDTTCAGIAARRMVNNE